jgi:hypothetical protein
MTKARDISSLIGSSGQIDNTKITLDANEIPALDTSKITTGTFADARISASSVSQHAQSFDDNKIVNDISTLALRQASDANKSAYSTGSSSVDVFQDSTGIDTTTNVSRNDNEYISSISQSATFTPTIIGDASRSATESKFGGYSSYFQGTRDTTGDYIIYNTSNSYDFSGDWTIEAWIKTSSSDSRLGICARRNRGVAEGWFVNLYNGKIAFGYNDSSSGWLDNSGTGLDLVGTSDLRDGNWHHIAIVRASNVFSFYVDGTRESTTSAYTGTVVHSSASYNLAIGDNASNAEGTQSGNTSTTFAGYIDDLRINNNAVYSGTSYTVPTSALVPDANTLIYCPFDDVNLEDKTNLVVSATGNFTGTTITAPSSVSSMGAIITYQDQYGTNALNTDLVLQLSADGGSNYSTATLTALPDFSTGIKMAKVNDLAVTAGTSLKYKISFANQASGTKEARIRGVALQY